MRPAFFFELDPLYLAFDEVLARQHHFLFELQNAHNAGICRRAFADVEAVCRVNGRGDAGRNFSRRRDGFGGSRE